MRVAEGLHGLGKRHPADLVHLLVGDEGAPEGMHQPVPDDLRPPVAVRVADLPGGAVEPALESGLLPDLPEGRRLGGLASLQLALGEAPVVVRGTVHHGDERRAAVEPPHDDASCGLHNPSVAHGRSPP